MRERKTSTLPKEVKRNGELLTTSLIISYIVVDSEYVEALQREVREKETFDVLRQLRTEAKIVVGTPSPRENLRI